MQTTIPDIAPRFQPPSTWRSHYFTNRNGYRLRYACALPDGKSRPDAVVVILPGLREFCELYCETAHNLLTRNIGVCVIDWLCQGGSDRLLDNPHKRHTISFLSDMRDLDEWLRKDILPMLDAQYPERPPMVMLGHSMGGNIGLTHLYARRDLFTCAAFTAPMLGIAAFSQMPDWLTRLFTEAANQTALRRSYVPGASDWSLELRNRVLQYLYTSDKERGMLHNQWLNQNPRLRIGNITWKWLLEAERACRRVNRPGVLKRITTPILLARAGRDALIERDQLDRAAGLLPHAELLDLPGARHEILMEDDTLRDQFIKNFLHLIDDNCVGDNGIKEYITGDFSMTQAQRLYDPILEALNLAIEQQDLETAEHLEKALELSMTRMAGGRDFVERRDYPSEIEEAIESLRTLREKQGAV
jgi:lysophospholipase